MASRLGTAVDIKVRTRDGKVILIEPRMRVQWGVYFHVPRSTEWAWCVAEGMTDIPANARTYSLIQLAWTWVLHNHSASVRADMAYVLNVNDSGRVSTNWTWAFGCDAAPVQTGRAPAGETVCMYRGGQQRIVNHE